MLCRGRIFVETRERLILSNLLETSNKNICGLCQIHTSSKAFEAEPTMQKLEEDIFFLVGGKSIPKNHNPAIGHSTFIMKIDRNVIFDVRQKNYKLNTIEFC